jgi:cytochrome c556
MLRTSVFLAAGALLAAGSALASGEDASDAEKAVEYRQAVFTAMGHNFGPMVAMMKGEIAWDGDAFAKRAERVAALATMPWEGFVEGTADIAHSEAKAVIWDERAEFDQLADRLGERTAALAEVAGSGDRERIGKQFKKVGETCKSCHDDFKQED